MSIVQVLSVVAKTIACVPLLSVVFKEQLRRQLALPVADLAFLFHILFYNT